MILVAGSANLDFVVHVPNIPKPGETVLGRDLAFFPGGKGANQAIACARSGGAATEMLVALGDDWFAEPIERSLADAGVRTHLVRVTNCRTGAAFISVSDDAENAIAVASGANNELSADDLPPISAYSHLLLQLETPVSVVTEYARVANEHGVKVVLNAAPAQRLPPELLAMIDVLIVNEGELAVVADYDGTVVNAMERVQVPCVVVTLGSRGCCAAEGGRQFFRPGNSVVAVDTTAAGDTFCGVLVAALSQNRSLQRALEEANAAGALACTAPGAQTSIPSCEEVEAFLQSSPAATETKMEALRSYCGFKHE